MSKGNALRLVDTTSQSTKATKLRGGRPTNKEMRRREHLTLDEVRQLLKAAQSSGRASLRKRNHLMMLMMYRHGLRVRELCALRWEDIHLGSEASIYIERLKGSISGTHPLAVDECRGLLALQKRQGVQSGFVFTTATGKPLVATTVRELVLRLGVVAGLPFRVHPHMLRHSCGFDLAGQGVDLRTIQVWLGHRSISNTTSYVALAGHALRKVQPRV